jgi:predicted membrane protein
MKFIKYIFGYLSENSKQSMMRLISLLIILLAIFITLWNLIHKIPIDYYGLSSILGVAVAGKSVQKYFENNNNSDNSIDDISQTFKS